MNSVPSRAVDLKGAVAGAGKRGAAFDRLLFVMAVLAVSYTTLSYLGGSFWILELLTHFRAQAAAGALGLMLLSAARRRPGTAGLAAVAIAANLMPLLPYLVSISAASNPGASDIRIMVANVSKRSTSYAALLGSISEENPDIIGLLETNETWVSELAELGSEYPHSVLRPEDGAYGMALYSRFPLEEHAESPYTEDGIQTAVVASLSLPAGPATLVLAHLMAPLGAWEADLRNRQLERLAGLLERDPSRERILLGDLNITPWSPYYRPLERDAGMVNAARGRGYHPTWPARVALMQIPIDHCLLSEGLSATAVRRGGDIGSDHLPLIVDVSLAKGWSRVHSAE